MCVWGCNSDFHFVCVCAGSQVHVCMCVYIQACHVMTCLWNSKNDLWYLCSPSLLEARSVTLFLHCIDQAIWSASFWVFSCLGLYFPTGMLGLQRHATTSSSYAASGDLNSALTLEEQALLPTEPPSQPLKSSLVAAWVSVASTLQSFLR